MRTLVIGAGAVGGYFGGRLLEAKRDITFLVRPGRAGELAARGLQIRSPFGDVSLPRPATVLAEDLASTFDLILLSCKAYDLEEAIRALAPAVGPETTILPLLNGMRHLDALDAEFGAARVLGGRCLIAATLNGQREIVHLNKGHTITFGERDGRLSQRAAAIDSLMQGAIFDHKASPHILLDMWEKWTFLASLAGATCLLRGSIGEICAAPGGREFVLRLIEECRTIAAAAGFPLTPAALERTRTMLTESGSTLTASMLRDMEAGGAIEADHVIGDLLRTAESPLLRLVYTNLKVYEARRPQTDPHPR
ncbi:MAG: 2-dehydropantoate 2-reductase [Candidatus Solibacter sp.]